MKTIIKIFILFIFSVLAIYFLYSQNILDFNALQRSFENHKKLIFFVALMQVLNCLFMTLRYYSLLKIFEIKTNFQNVVAATFVSNGIGQWLPGSMAVIEVIRIGLMLGANKNQNEDTKVNQEEDIKNNLTELTIKSKLAAVSLFDRLIGFLVMLFVGFIMTLYVYFQSYQKSISNINSLLSLVLLSAFLSLCIVLLPVFANMLFFRKFFERLERLFLRVFRSGFLNKLFRKFFHEMNSLFDAVVLGSRRISFFWKPIIYSVICLIFASLGMYFSGVAISGQIPIEAILAVMSILSIASLLPLGLGGMGGMQIVAAIVFSIFQVSPQSAGSAQLLQTAVNLLAISGVGIFFARLSANQIRAILQSRKSESLLPKKYM